MKWLKIFFRLLCFPVIIACNKPSAIPHTESLIKTLIKNISIDTVLLEAENTSNVGEVLFCKDSVAFCDYVFCQISSYGLNGDFKNVFLGKGRGPKEIKDLQKAILTSDKKYVLENWVIHTFDREWNEISTFKVNLDNNKTYDYLMKHANAEEKGVYEVKYFRNQFVLADSGQLFFNVESTHPSFNGYFLNSASKYYQSAHLVAKVNAQTGNVSDLLGNYSQIYQDRKCLPNFANWTYDITPDSVYLTFDIDEKIYVSDKSFSPVRSFGIAPSSTKNVSYIATKSAEEANERFKEDRSGYSYFSGLKFIKEKNILLRTYTTGERIKTSSPDEILQKQRMQIYRANVLIGDVSVPERFVIIGYDEDYIYADGFRDTKLNKVGYYRFKLNI